MSEPLTLGQRVRFQCPLFRTGDIGPWNGPDDLYWTDHKYPMATRSPEGIWRDGVVVGSRTLSNGRVTYNGEDGTDYRPTEHFKAYLIAFDMRRKPVYVKPENVIAIEGQK